MRHIIGGNTGRKVVVAARDHASRRPVLGAGACARTQRQLDVAHARERVRCDHAHSARECFLQPGVRLK